MYGTSKYRYLVVYKESSLGEGSGLSNLFEGPQNVDFSWNSGYECDH